MQPEHVPTPPTLDTYLHGSTYKSQRIGFFPTDASNPPTFDSPNPQITQAGRPLWHYRLPVRYQDLLPDGPTPSWTTNHLPPVTPGSTARPKSSYMFVTRCAHTSIVLDCSTNIQTDHHMILILQFVLRICLTTTRFGHLRTGWNPLPNLPIILLPGCSRICWLTCWWTGWWQEVTWSLWERSVDWWRMWLVLKTSILMNWPHSTLSGSSIGWTPLKQLMPQILLLAMAGWNTKSRYLSEWQKEEFQKPFYYSWASLSITQCSFEGCPFQHYQPEISLFTIQKILALSIWVGGAVLWWGIHLGCLVQMSQRTPIAAKWAWL